MEKPLPTVPRGWAAAGAKAPQGWSRVQAGQALRAMAKAQLPRKPAGMQYLLLVWPSAELPSQQPCSKAAPATRKVLVPVGADVGLD